jgi:hypothetical protein
MRVEADRCNPARNKPSILPGGHTAVVITAAAEEELARFLASGFDVVVDGLPRLLRQLKPDGSTGFLLANCRAIDCIPTRCNILNPKCDDIATPQLAVDCQIEHRQVAYPPVHLQPGRIDQTCFGSNGGFWPMSLPLFQGSPRGVGAMVCA